MTSAKRIRRSTTPNEVEEPIINSPFAEPGRHWLIAKGQTPVKVPGRRPASYFYRVPSKATRGRKQAGQLALMAEASIGELEELALVNRLRQQVREWRAAGYPGTTALTRELLALWSAGSDRRGQRLFFAQLEAAETIIFLVEPPAALRKGLPPIPLDRPGAGTRAAGFRAFTRYACKMATGTGKIIEWQPRRQGQRHPVPPVFIVVCRDTRIANPPLRSVITLDGYSAWMGESWGTPCVP